MSRFYQSGKPDFVENFMYTPPWELAQQALQYNDKGISESIKAASLFDNINVDYIPDPVEKANVEKELKNYSDKADEYSTNMQLQLQNSPQSWKKYMPQLQTLGTDLSKNMKSGNLAKIQQSAAALAKWKEDNKDVAEKDPLFYNSGLNTFLSKWQENPNRSLDNTFSAENLSKFDLHSKEIMDEFNKFETDLKSVVGNNGYIYDNEGVTRNRVISAFMNRVFSDPQAQAYLRQAQAFKMPGFVDATGKPIPVMAPVNKETGEQISEEEYNKEKARFATMNDAQKAKEGIKNNEFGYEIAPNKNFAWTGAFEGLADVKAGMKQKITADTTFMGKMKIASAERVANARIAADFQIENMRVAASERAALRAKDQEKDKLLAKLEYDVETEPDPGKKAKLQEKLDAYNKSTAVDIAQHNLNISLDELQKELANPEKDSKTQDVYRNLNRNLVGQALAKLGLGEVTEAKLMDNGRDFYNIKSNSKEKADLAKFIISIDKKATVKPSLFSYNPDISREHAIEYLRNKGYKDSDLFKKDKDPLNFWRLTDEPGSKRAGYYDTPLLEKYTKAGNKYMDTKKQVLKDYAQTKKEIEIIPVTSAGESKIRNTYMVNPDIFQVIGTDMKTGAYKGLPSLASLATSGKILGVSKQSGFGPGTEFMLGEVGKERKFIVVPKGTRDFTNTRNKLLFDDETLYSSPEHLKTMRYATEAPYQDALINIASELAKSKYSYTDNKNKDEEGKPLKYTSVSIPLQKGQAANIRYYPEDTKTGTYTVVAGDGSTVFKTNSFLEIGKAVELIEKSFNEQNNEVIKSNITF